MINTKWEGGTEEEYETQHFGFGSQRFKIAIRQMVEEKITTGIKNMESCLQESLELNETDKETLSRSCDKLIHLYCDRAGPSLEIIDEEIQKMLEIPSNVLLPEDELQLEQVSDSSLEKLKEELANLRKRVKRGALMEAHLKAEEEELSTIEQVCETAKKDMEEIYLLSKDDSLKTIQNETQFVSALAPFLVKDIDNIFND